MLGARIPGATVHIEPDAEHLLLIDRAPRCADLIGNFLRGGAIAPNG